MKISNSGLQKIIQREGVFLHTYKDSVGVLTIGTGHTSAAGPPKVTAGMVITKAQNDSILLADLAPIEKQINNAVKVPITQNQYDALVSIVFNVGPGFLKSTAMRLLNKKDYKGAANAIMLWNKPPEIIGRRKTEQVQFLTPDSNIAAHASAGAAVAAGAAAVATSPSHLWPYIAAGTLVSALVIWASIYIYRKEHK